MSIRMTSEGGIEAGVTKERDRLVYSIDVEAKEVVTNYEVSNAGFARRFGIALNIVRYLTVARLVLS